MALSVKKFLFQILIFTVAILIIAYLFSANKKSIQPETYTIKSYKNTIALYKNSEIIKTYDGIVLNTLPKKDIENFNNGITVESPTQADIFLEDFD